MATDYTTLEDLKEDLGIDATDTSRDARLQRLIGESSRQIDDHCDRVFWMADGVSQRLLATRGRVVVDDDGERLLVDDIALDENLVVEVGGGDSWTPVTGFEVERFDSTDPDRPIVALTRLYGTWRAWPRVRITAVWGWPAVPLPVGQACRAMAARTHRDTPDSGAGGSEWDAPPRSGQMTPGVRQLLQHYQRLGLA